jgi:hypothetical protein
MGHYFSARHYQTFCSRQKHIKNDDYYHSKHGIILEDLHDENVFKGAEENLLFVDPVIYLETIQLRLGGATQFVFPFRNKIFSSDKV